MARVCLAFLMCIGATVGRRMTRRQVEAAVSRAPDELVNLTVFEPSSGDTFNFLANPTLHHVYIYRNHIQIRLAATQSRSTTGSSPHHAILPHRARPQSVYYYRVFICSRSGSGDHCTESAWHASGPPPN